MRKLSWSLRRPALWLVLVVGVLLLSACGSRITNTNWAGLSSDGSRVYLAFGPQVLAYDPETRTQSWIYPDKQGTVQFYSAPLAQDNRVIFGDYGRPGGLFSPRVTVSIYALENVESGTPRELWIDSESAADKIVAPPLQVGDQVFVGTADNHVLALNVDDGHLNWDFTAGHAIWGQPAYRDNILYIASMDWSVYALDAATGQQIWKTRLDGALPSGPVLGDDLLYVSSFGGSAHALNLKSGDLVWSAPASSVVWGAPALADGTVYFSDIQGDLHAVDAKTGEEKWIKATGARVQATPVVVGDAVYVASQTTDSPPAGMLSAYSIADGNQLWSQKVQAPLATTPVIVGGDSIVVGTQDTAALLIGFNLATGQELWRYALPETGK